MAAYMAANNTCHHLHIGKRFHSFLLAGGISYSRSCHFMASSSNATSLSVKHSVLQDDAECCVSIPHRCDHSRHIAAPSNTLLENWKCFGVCIQCAPQPGLTSAYSSKPETAINNNVPLAQRALNTNHEEFSLQHGHSHKRLFKNTE